MQPFFFTEIQNAIDEKKKNQGEISEWTSRRKEREMGEGEGIGGAKEELSWRRCRKKQLRRWKEARRISKILPANKTKSYEEINAKSSIPNEHENHNNWRTIFGTIWSKYIIYFIFFKSKLFIMGTHFVFKPSKYRLLINSRFLMFKWSFQVKL